jgi:hypothetical protein
MRTGCRNSLPGAACTLLPVHPIKDAGVALAFAAARATQPCCNWEACWCAAGAKGFIGLQAPHLIVHKPLSMQTKAAGACTFCTSAFGTWQPAAGSALPDSPGYAACLQRSAWWPRR